MSRDVAFPMKDPFSPVTRARVPVPGLNRFPGRANLLNRHYYGMDDAEGVTAIEAAVPGKAVAFNSEAVKVVNAGNDDEAAGFAGFSGFGSLGFLDRDSFPQINIPEGGGGGGIDWGAIINAGIHAAPAIIQAAEGGGAPYNYYQQAVGLPSQQSQVPAGYYRDASGNLISLASAAQAAGGLGVGVAQIGNSLSNFVAQNPLLVLAGGAAILLLFMRPPGRR